MAILSADDVLQRILRECRVHGEVAVARRYRVSQAHLSNIRKGRGKIGPKLVAAMGLELVYRELDG